MEVENSKELYLFKSRYFFNIPLSHTEEIIYNSCGTAAYGGGGPPKVFELTEAKERAAAVVGAHGRTATHGGADPAAEGKELHAQLETPTSYQRTSVEEHSDTDEDEDGETIQMQFISGEEYEELRVEG